MIDSSLEEKWPILGRHEHAARWLRMWADLGRAPRTIDAYGVGLAEYLEVCERENVDLVEGEPRAYYQVRAGAVGPAGQCGAPRGVD